MKKTIFLSALAGISASAFGGIMYNTPGDVYTQNFDTLATTGTANTWTNNSTITGWHLFRQDGNAVTSYIASSGTSTTGAFYSFGSASNNPTDRALGGVGSNNFSGWIAMSVVNNTGNSLTEFSILFNGEQWRNGGNTSAQTMVLEYGFGATFATVASWTAPGGAFNWASPVATSSSAAVDGNDAGRVNGVGGTIGSLAWNPGATLWVRWVELNDPGSDHGLAIDDVRFSAIPTPGSAALLGMGGLIIGRRRR